MKSLLHSISIQFDCGDAETPAPALGRGIPLSLLALPLLALVLSLSACAKSEEEELTVAELELVSLSTKNQTVNLMQNIEVTATIENKGESESAAAELKLYISDDNVISSSEDDPLSAVSLPAIAGGESVIVKSNFNAPSTEGKVYIGACAQTEDGEICSKGTQQIVELKSVDYGEGGPFALPDTGQTTGITNVAGEDSDYSGNAKSYTDNGSTVTDNNTLLIWEKLANATDHVDIDYANAVTRCNDQTTGGFDDWRLPSLFELITISNLSGGHPTIDQTFFPNTQSVPLGFYWSSTPLKASINRGVMFSKGTSLHFAHAEPHFVRCVRGRSTPRVFSANGVTVTEQLTGLVWQRQDDDTKRTWENALTYCESLNLDNQTDWRLPNVIELLSAHDFNRSNPAMDDAFQNVKTITSVNSNIDDTYWTSSYSPVNTNDVISVKSSLAQPTFNAKTATKYVRCVRG